MDGEFRYSTRGKYLKVSIMKVIHVEMGMNYWPMGILILEDLKMEIK